MKSAYPAKISPEDGGFVVQFIDLDEAFTEGDTLDDALFNAAEVLTLTLEGRIEEGAAIPEPSQNIEGAHYVNPDAKTQAAMLLRHIRGKRSMADLAKGLDTSWASAARLEDPSHWPSLKTLDRAARVLGKRLTLDMV
jgi:antitoxin HicB